MLFDEAELLALIEGAGVQPQSPIFPLLRDVLVEALAKPSPRPPHYMLAKLQAYYVINPDHLTDRVKRVLRAAGFVNEVPVSGDPCVGARRHSFNAERRSVIEAFP